MYSYSYYHGPNPVVTVILFLIALVGGICAYLMFVKSDEEPKDPRLLKLKEFLSFNKMIIEGLLKATYIIFALFITLYSFQIMVGTSFITGLMLLILLNIMLRIGYEASLIVLLIWRNTSDISKKLGKNELTGLESTGLEAETEVETKVEEPVVKAKPRTRKPKTTDEKDVKKPAKKKSTTKKTTSKKANVEEVKAEEPSTKEETK